FDGQPQLNTLINNIDDWSLLCSSNISDDGIHKYFINNNRTAKHRFVIVGLRELNTSEVCSNKSLTPPITDQPFNFSANYELRTFTSACYYLDSNNNWQSDGLLNDILGKFELINHGHLHLSPYFSVIGTVLIKIISHRTLTTDDLCIFSRILQDDIINKTTSNWSILKDFIQLFRSILHTEFVKNIYFELINDEQELTKSHDGIRFEGKKRSHIT
ncbi:unnamed protein product, partial [Rotaria magnacalcarata]